MKIFPQENVYARANYSKYQTEQNNGIKNNDYWEASTHSLSQN